MTSQDQPRGSRETYERLSDPAMYWTQVNAQPIREPILREPRDQAGEQPPPHPSPQPSQQPHNPYRELSPDWQEEGGQEETMLADILPYEDEEPAYDDRRTYQPESYRTDSYRTDRYRDDDELDAHERFGGVNWGAGFFGWIVAVGFTVFLSAVLGVVFAVLRRTVPAVGNLADTQPATSAVALAVAGVAVLMLAYYAGGYVAGRMSRFDGGRQGAGVWVTGVLLTALALGVALFFGSSYDVVNRLHLPSPPTTGDSMGIVGLGAAVAAGVGSLLAAIGGGKVGCRYHRKVDEYL